MNGLLDAQTSSNIWGSTAMPMLHENMQTDTPEHANSSYDHSIFGSLEQQIALAAIEFDDTIDMLKRRFIFSDADVENFLRSHRSVTPLLLQAGQYMTQAFGENTPLTLEIMPEDDSPHTVYALAMWRGEQATARRALNQFDESWLLDNLKRTAGRVVFDYELI